MRILVLGNSASRWQKEFIRNVLLPLEHEVYVFASRGENPFKPFYHDNAVKVITPKPVSKMVMRIPKLRAEALLKNQITALRQYGPYDIIINMFVSESGLRCAKALRDKNTKVIAYFCGSDILRAKGYKLMLLKKELRIADKIFFASEQVYQEYRKKVDRMGDRVGQVIHLGISVFAEIDRIRGPIATEKQILGIPDNLTSICIGYNANQAQQHLSALHQLQLLPAEQKEKLILLLPLTYGRRQEYIDELKQELTRSGFKYRLFESFMNDKEMAQLHCATDIFINAQLTDGLSASVLETLYAESTLLNASWLDYPEFQKWGIQYAAFSGFEELPELVLSVLEGKVTCDTKSNMEILNCQMTWEATRNQWSEQITG